MISFRELIHETLMNNINDGDIEMRTWNVSQQSMKIGSAKLAMGMTLQS